MDVIEIRCAGCGGRGCDQCNEGRIELRECPLKVITGQSRELMRFAGYARDSGMWPVQGGALDQSAAFLAAESLIRSDLATWRRAHGLD